MFEIKTQKDQKVTRHSMQGILLIDAKEVLPTGNCPRWLRCLMMTDLRDRVRMEIHLKVNKEMGK